MTSDTAPGDAPSVTVVGAGLSGLLCARELARAGLAVTVLDKARGTSGRMATRRAEGLAFDHGAQYFTARSQPFRQLVGEWLGAGVVCEWTAPLVRLCHGAVEPAHKAQRYVGVPGMSAVGRHLAEGLDVRVSQRVTRLQRDGDGLRVRGADGRSLGRSDAVVLALPAPQAAALLGDVAPALAASVGAVTHTPCWALMVSFAEPLPVPWGGAFVADGPLDWIARDASKPGRPSAESWVLHATPEWSRRLAHVAPEQVGPELLRALAALVGRPLPPVVHGCAHFWAYARPTEALSAGCLGSDRLGVCGDWCADARVEGAALSARALAERLLTVLGR